MSTHHHNPFGDLVNVSRAALLSDAQTMQTAGSAQLAIIKLIKKHHHKIDEAQWLGLLEALRVLAKEVEQRGLMREEWLDSSAEYTWRVL
jgi:uncharacterized NAD(P)/FAD-binding protein YdhS